MNYENRVHRQVSLTQPQTQAPERTKRNLKQCPIRQAWNSFARIVWDTLPESRREAGELLYACLHFFPKDHPATTRFNEVLEALFLAECSKRFNCRDRRRSLTAGRPSDVITFHMTHRLDVAKRKKLCRDFDILGQRPIGRPEPVITLIEVPRWIRN